MSGKLVMFSYLSFFSLPPTAWGVASVGVRATFSSPDENARAGETAPSPQCQPTLAAPLVMGWFCIKIYL